MKLSPIIIFLALFPAVLFSGGYIDYLNTGKPIYQCMTQTAARGQAGVTTDVLINPACSVPGKYYFAVNVGMNYTTESEVVTIFDSYNNRMGMLTVSQNSKSNLTPYSAILYFNTGTFGAGLLTSQFMDYDYEYKYTERNSFYQVVSETFKKSSGQGNAFGLTARYFSDNFSAGVEVDYLLLNRTKTYEIIYFEAGRIDTITTDKTENAAFVFKGGVLSSFDRYSFGLAISTSDETTNTPIKSTLGLCVEVPGFIPAKIHLDYTRSFYSQINDSLDDVNALFFGLENKFYNKTVFSLGGGYEENFSLDQANSFFFSTGFSYDFYPTTFSMSFRYAQRDYTKPFESEKTVRESTIGLICGITYLI
ncbi:hypothetical protein JXA84_04655 [candidate division WOR-3 bacterium]|nr:hypothetical protein [candidate division WOR-3 bacterium]